MKKLSRGQSTLEYVIILAAVVGAMVVVAGMLKDKISDGSGSKTGGAYDQLSEKMRDKVANFKFSNKP